MKARPQKPRRRVWDQSGQVEAETAIVIPLVTFLLLGLIQLGMLHQARLFAKYAAYRAVRAGALRNLDKSNGYAGMCEAAVAAAMPILSYASGNAEVLPHIESSGDWQGYWLGGSHNPNAMYVSNMMPDVGMEYAEITICGPLKKDVEDGVYEIDGTKYVAFDNPKIAGDGIKTKLRIQLTLNYRMPIPFADWTIYRMWKGMKTVKELRLGEGEQEGYGGDKYDQAAQQGVHIIPIRVQYAMKIHSDAELDSFPPTNECL